MKIDPRLKIIELRAKAVALSEQGGVENIQRAGEYLIECIEYFKELFPDSASLSPNDIKGKYAWVSREWALTNETAGLIYAQKGEVEATLKAFKEAEKFFVSEEDLNRLEKNRKAVDQRFRDYKLMS